MLMLPIVVDNWRFSFILFKSPRFRILETFLSGPEDGNLQSISSMRDSLSSGLSSGQLWIALGLFMLSIVGSSSAQFAVPERYGGFVYNSVPEQRSPVVWEVFIDPLCRNCKSGWLALTQVAERYGSSLFINVHALCVTHFFPCEAFWFWFGCLAWLLVDEAARLRNGWLCCDGGSCGRFHHNAFFAARALHISQMMNAALMYPLLEIVFKNQETFSNPSTKYETPAHVISRLISLTDELGIAADSFEAGFNDAATDVATRISFKYGCSRRVIGTPTYLVNGVTAAGANYAWSVDDWAKIFDPMVQL